MSLALGNEVWRGWWLKPSWKEDDSGILVTGFSPEEGVHPI